MENLKILAIETSCDDTCIAIIDNNKIISNTVISSCKKQNEYGGVVPELAAREHENNIINAFKEATSNSTLDFDYIAYTSNPGLRVCLNVGEAFAYSLSYLLNVSLLPINHIYSHIFSFAYEKKLEDIQFPFISLVASGGHTSIFLVKSVDQIEVLNETKDDAVGEVYDKVARTLNLGYPGGPKIDQLFNINQATIRFLNNNPTPASVFSFSGLKTNVLNYINHLKMKSLPIDIVQIVSSFQKEIIDILIHKLKYYLNLYQINTVAIGGGVSANKYLQAQIKALDVNNIYIPKLNLCGDNAAMIAIYANLLINHLKHND